MKFASLMLGAAVLSIASPATAAQEAMSYPPLDMPLYLECRMQDWGGNLPYSEWKPLVLFFSAGVSKADTTNQVVDPHNQLEGHVFDFSIVEKSHWSLIARNGTPITNELLDRPQIMFNPPPAGPANMRITFLRGKEPARTGLCIGLIGPNAQGSYDKARANPDSLDNL
jgi:hypothetical protein